MELILLI